MSHHAFDVALVYHQHVADGITTARGHLTAAALASYVADIQYLQAAQASSAGERKMFLRAADKARGTRDRHELAAEITAIGEQVSSQ